MRFFVAVLTLAVFSFEVFEPSSAFVRLPNRVISRILRNKIAHSSRHLVVKNVTSRADEQSRNAPSPTRKPGKLLSLLAIVEAETPLPHAGPAIVAAPDTVPHYRYDLLRSIYHPPNVA